MTDREKWTIGSQLGSSPGGASSFASMQASAGCSGHGSCVTTAVISRPRRSEKRR